MGEFKAKSPSGQCPYLEFDDGSTLVQSVVTVCYAAEAGGLRSSDALARAKEMEVLATLEEVCR
jgi:glutathione S-transferase